MVLVILGLVTAMSAVRLQGPYRIARLHDVVERVGFIDEQARAHARRFARAAELVFDLDANEIYVRSGAGGDLAHFRMAIPRGVRLDRVYTRQGQAESRQVKIDVTSDGQSPSYAVLLSAGKAGQQWVFFSGTTGQVTLLEGQSDVEAVFRLLD